MAIMNISSSHIHFNLNSPFPNVVNFPFDYLRKFKDQHKIKRSPIRCRSCKNVLLNSNTCCFCFVENVDVSDDHLPQMNDVEFVIKGNKYDDIGDAKYIVFCLDMSGSMNDTVLIDECTKLATDERKKQEMEELANELKKVLGDDFSMDLHCQHGVRPPPPGKKWATRKEIILTAIIENIRSILEERQDKKIVIVTFNDEIKVNFVKNDKIEKLAFKDEASLKDTKKIDEFFKNITLVDHLTPNSTEILNREILNFKNDGQTALGPALYLSLRIASKRSGSTVFVFTDGLANLGLGSLAGDISEQQVSDFYNMIADMANSQRVSISVATIKGENSRLNLLGEVAKKSGGEIISVDPTDFETIIFDFNQTTTEGGTFVRNMVLTLVVPNGFCIKGADNSNKITKNLGSIKNHTEIAFEIVGTEDARNYIGRELPIQIELEHKNDQGADVIRVIKILKEVTDDRNLVERNADRCILGSYVIRARANLNGHSDDLVSFARLVSQIKPERDDRFDRDKFNKHLKNAGIVLDDQNRTNGENLDDDDESVVLRYAALKVTSDNLRAPLRH